MGKVHVAIVEDDKEIREMLRNRVDHADGMTTVRVFANAESFLQGFAQLDTFPPDVKYVDLLIDVQAADGSWANTESNAWWEDRPQLVTAWSVIALEQVLK